jgi:hypothetical protein
MKEQCLRGFVVCCCCCSSINTSTGSVLNALYHLSIANSYWLSIRTYDMIP